MTEATRAPVSAAGPIGRGRAKQAEPSDPLVATAVAVPTPGYDGMAAMARAFVEEFALAGWPEERIARMFRLPRYVAPHTVYRQKGPEFIDRLIASVFGRDVDSKSEVS